MQAIAKAALTVVVMAGSVLAQEGTPAEVAARLSGTWKLNRELSPSLAAPGRSGGRGGARGGGPSLALGLTAPQRGSRGGGRESAPGGGNVDIPPEEVLALRVLQAFEQIPTDLTIAATATAVTFVDPSGQGTFAIDGKTSGLDIAGSKIKVKTTWDRATLKQELSTSRRKVIRSWALDAGNRLVLTMKVESLTPTPDLRAVFDRQ